MYSEDYYRGYDEALDEIRLQIKSLESFGKFTVPTQWLLKLIDDLQRE